MLQTPLGELAVLHLSPLLSREGHAPFPTGMKYLLAPPPPGSATACQLAWLAADCIIEKRNIHLTFLYEMNFMY